MEVFGIAAVILLMGILVNKLVTKYVLPYLPSWMFPRFEAVNAIRRRSKIGNHLQNLSKDLDIIFAAQNKNHDQFVRIKHIFDSLTSEIAQIFLLTSSHQNSQLNEKTDSLWVRVNSLEVRVKQLLLDFEIRCQSRHESVGQLVSQQVALHNSPYPDPVLTGLIGHDYPYLQQANIPFQDYVDAKINNLGKAIGKHKQHLASCIQQDHVIIEKEMGRFQDFMKAAFEQEVKWIHQQMQVMELTIQKQEHAIEAQNSVIQTLSNANPKVQTPSKDMIPTPQVQGDPSSGLELLVPPPLQFLSDPPPQIALPPNENKEDEIPAWCISRPQIMGTKEEEIPMNPTTTIMQTPSSSSGPVLFHSVGNIPPPKFNPNIDSAENFIMELENHMERKRFLRKD